MADGEIDAEAAAPAEAAAAAAAAREEAAAAQDQAAASVQDQAAVERGAPVVENGQSQAEERVERGQAPTEDSGGAGLAAALQL